MVAIVSTSIAHAGHHADHKVSCTESPAQEAYTKCYNAIRDNNFEYARLTREIKAAKAAAKRIRNIFNKHSFLLFPHDINNPVKQLYNIGDAASLCANPSERNKDACNSINERTQGALKELADLQTLIVKLYNDRNGLFGKCEEDRVQAEKDSQEQKDAGCHDRKQRPGAGFASFAGERSNGRTQNPNQRAFGSFLIPTPAFYATPNFNWRVNPIENPLNNHLRAFRDSSIQTQDLYKTFRW